jgi:DHA2 family multidrug resistance protein
MSATLEAPQASEIQQSSRSVTPEQWLGFTGMVFGIFMAVLDIQIVASSLEQIQAGLSATREEITWVQTAYLVAEVVVIPLSGWLGRALSSRYLFALSCGGFTLMSLCCALAWNLPSMVAFRTFQGLVGGAMIPSVFAMIYTLFPPRLQPAMGIVVGMVVTVAPTAGPVLGGYLTEVVSWKALFLINLLPGLLVTLSTWLFLKVDEPDWTLLGKIDFLGILYIVIFLGSVQFVLEEGVKEEWFESREIVFFTLVAVASGTAMFYRELTIGHPIVDLWAFRNRNFAVGCIFSFILGSGLYTIIYLMPVYLASVKGLNSLQIGQYVMVTGLFQFVSAFAAGALVKILDSRLMLALGLLLFGLGCWLNGNLTHEAGY